MAKAAKMQMSGKQWKWDAIVDCGNHADRSKRDWPRHEKVKFSWRTNIPIDNKELLRNTKKKNHGKEHRLLIQWKAARGFFLHEWEGKSWSGWVRGLSGGVKQSSCETEQIYEIIYVVSGL